MKILFYQWDSYMNEGITIAFKKLGIEYDSFYYPKDNWEEDPVLEDMLNSRILQYPYELVFTVNFSPVVSMVCERVGIRYVSWVYDSPMNVWNLDSMKNSCNEIYLFDRGQAQAYCQMGIHVRHMPLAVNTDLFAEAIQKAPKEQFSAEISLVGKLYQTEYAKYTSMMPDYIKGYLEACINSQLQVYGSLIVPQLITDSVLEQMNEVYEKQGLSFQMGRRELEYMLESEVTSKERVVILALLSKYFDTHLYSYQKDERIQNLKVHDRVSYMTEMPVIFSHSKINLNIGFKGIRTGMSLRVLDVLGSGGFLLSNWQEELIEHFTPGVECEVYSEMGEVYEKSDYYLKHEDARQKIAFMGYEKVKKEFSFENQLKKIIG